MARLFSPIGLAVVATLLMAACHTNSPGTMGGDEMPPMMYKGAPPACASESPRPAVCSPAQAQ